MAIAALGGYTYVDGPNGGTTSAFPLDTTGMSLLVVSVAWYQANSITVSDNKSNTWTPLTAKATADTACQLFYAVNPTVGTNHQFTVSGTSIYACLLATAFSGTSTTSPFDVENGATATSAITISTGSVTPGQNNELVVSALGFSDNASGAVSVNGGLTIVVTRAFIGGAAQGASLAYLIQTSAAAANPQWNVTNSDNYLAACIATFKAAAAATKAPPSFRRPARFFQRSF